MGYTPQPTGRVAREINNRIREDLTVGHQKLAAAIGERNPVRVQQILRDVFPLMVQAINGSWMIENLHVEWAKRGPYDKGHDEDKDDS